jgi:small neutral amino acid transporter SnatA (MarC family)
VLLSLLSKEMVMRFMNIPVESGYKAGGVLLLKAGPTFIRGNADSDKAFSLLAEVEDSAPPRLRLLIPAIVITVAMLAV